MLNENPPQNEAPKGEVLNEQQYYQECVDYALSTGWVKKEEKDILIEKYLKPIYQKYLEAIEEVKDEIRSDEDSGTTIEELIEKLNIIMERTKRIGSTDPTNITRSIGDFYRWSCRQDHYTDYAATSLGQFIAQKINQ